MTTVAKTRLLFIRHAETRESSSARLGGDPGLSPRGRDQARALAQALAIMRIDAAYVSPSRRAKETAAPIAAAIGTVPIDLPSLREIDFGHVDGLTYDEIAVVAPQVSAALLTSPTEVRFPGGESFTEFRDRVRTMEAEIVAKNTGTTVALVTHAGVIRLVLAAALRVPDLDMFSLNPEHGSISPVAYGDGSRRPPASEARRR